MKHIRKALITAAGRGTRQYPASATIQKELFPLVDVDGYAKPTLQIIVEEALLSGIEEICIVANPTNLEPIKAHFRGLTPEQRAGQYKGKVWASELSDLLDDAGKRITYTVQESQQGFGHAVYQSKEWAGDDPFILLVGDHVYVTDDSKRCAAQIIQLAENSGAEAFSGLMHTKESDVFRYGTVAATRLQGQDSVYAIAKMVEKPTIEFAKEHLRTPWLPDGIFYTFFGIHVFPPAIFDCLEHIIESDDRINGEIQLTTAQELLLSRCNYLCGEVNGLPHDMGIPEGLVETQIALALRSPFKENAIKLLSRN
jgi:UTP--glucose-1-phosphate uridylyltransferase